MLPEWVDYNGHATESSYLLMTSHAADALLGAIGIDADYLADGGSYYTVETHICHLDEAKAGDRLEVTTQVLGADEKRIHVFVRIMRGATTGCCSRRPSRCSCTWTPTQGAPRRRPRRSSRGVQQLVGRAQPGCRGRTRRAEDRPARRSADVIDDVVATARDFAERELRPVALAYDESEEFPHASSRAPRSSGSRATTCRTSTAAAVSRASRTASACSRSSPGATARSRW